MDLYLVYKHSQESKSYKLTLSGSHEGKAIVRRAKREERKAGGQCEAFTVGDARNAVEVTIDPNPHGIFIRMDHRFDNCGFSLTGGIKEGSHVEVGKRALWFSN